jgi:hypothetical protein
MVHLLSGAFKAMRIVGQAASVVVAVLSLSDLLKQRKRQQEEQDRYIPVGGNRRDQEET